MRYELIVRAYDVMDTVVVSVLYNSQEESLAVAPEWVPLVQESFCGTGEDDPRKWCRDALMWAAEAL